MFAQLTSESTIINAIEVSFALKVAIKYAFIGTFPSRKCHLGLCNPAMNRRKHLIWCVKSKAGTYESRWGVAEPVEQQSAVVVAGWHSKTSSRPFDLTSVLCSGEGPSRAHTSLCANSSKASVQKSSGRLSAVEYLARRCSPSMFTVQSAPPFDSQMTMTERQGLPGATMATSPSGVG